MEILEKIKPRNLDDGLETSNPQDSCFAPDVLCDIFEEIIRSPKQIHGAVLGCKGKIFAEAYSSSHNELVLHPMMSVTKSITSLLLGIAIDKGYIESENIRLIEYFPEFNGHFDDKLKREIRLKHILTHTSGFFWRELGIDYESNENSHFLMENSPDWFEFILSRPMEHIPGEIFEYNTGAYHLFSAILKRATGLSADKFAYQNLLEPLMIEGFTWSRDNLEYPCVAGSRSGVSLTPRSLLKIGFTILNSGLYKNRRIVSADWLNRTLSPVLKAPQGNYYGYGWWLGKLRTLNCYSAKGYAGQTLTLIPKLDLAAVFTGYDLELNKSYEHILVRLVRKY
ncbi:serine hydrolase [bacterium]|nr:serine hydrolase [bacterium]